MATNMLLYSTLSSDRPAVVAANSHSSGDFCYEQGYYGIADDTVAAGALLRINIRGVAKVPLPGSLSLGQKIYCPSKPSGVGVLTATSSSNVLVGIVFALPDGSGIGQVHLMPEQSMGN